MQMPTASPSVAPCVVFCQLVTGWLDVPTDAPIASVVLADSALIGALVIYSRSLAGSDPPAVAA